MKSDKIEILKDDIDILNEEDNPEYLGNEILYNMCKDYPKHTNLQEVYAKVWIIGRTYAVALERGKSKIKSEVKEVSDYFFRDTIVKTILDSDIDSVLENLKGCSPITESNIDDILNAYKQLINITDKFDRGTKHSFCSKYLHFHFPNLFFIYDTRAYESISRCGIKIPYSYNEILSKSNGLPYYQFFIKCFLLKEEIQKKYGRDLSPREIDSFLVNKANEKDRIQKSKIINS